MSRAGPNEPRSTPLTGPPLTGYQQANRETETREPFMTMQSFVVMCGCRITVILPIGSKTVNYDEEYKLHTIERGVKFC